MNADPDAAFGEAAVFSLLRTYFRLKPEPADAPGTGGADFVHKNADGILGNHTILGTSFYYLAK